jgi:Na+/H+-dicarboxylate symporter
MKEKLLKLHNQILIALILGAIFGALFSVNKKLLILSYKQNNTVKSATVKNWKQFIVILRNNPNDTTYFGGKAQLEILSKFQKLRKGSGEIDIVVKDFNIGESKSSLSEEKFEDVTNVEKEGTIATGIKWIGDIFIRLLSMIAVPLVLASLTVGAASLGDVKKFARIGGKTIALYLVTTAIAITIGLIIANAMQPGKQMSASTRDRLMSAYNQENSPGVESVTQISLIDQLVDIVPKNPMNAIANGDMLQIVFFAILLGLVLSLIDKEKSSSVLKFFDGLSDAMIKLVDIVMYIAPLGVFALIAATVGEFGFDILETLVWYVIAVLLGLLLHSVITYGSMIKFFTKLKIYTFFKGIRRAQTIAFSTSSSAATLPVNIECCQENLGISKTVTSFVLPLGATINMDGTALYQGVAAVFISQVFGMHLSFAQQATVVLTATLASIGTAPVPGVGIIMLIIILKSVGIPEIGIALILGVDRILDMCRTTINVTGDAAVAAVVASSEKEILIPKPVEEMD